MKLPTTPVLLASLTLASSSLAAPTSKKPADCESPSLGEKSPLLGQDGWGAALQLKGRGVGGQGRPWAGQKRQLTPEPPSPSMATAATPLLGNTGAGGAVHTDQTEAAASGLLSPVSGLLGSTTGTLKGVVGSTTGTLNGLLGNTPLGPLVGTVGDIGNGVLDTVGKIGNGGLGLGPILKPVKDVVGGLPIVGPIAGGVVDTVGGLNLAQQQDEPMGITPKSTPRMVGGSFANVPTPPMAQMVEETVVGRLPDGRLVTDSGRVLGLASSVTQGGPFSALPVQPPSGVTDTIGGIGRMLPNPLGGNPLSSLPNPLGGSLPTADLGRLISTLPPGLGQILQPVGGVKKYLQIGNQLIPLGAATPGQLAQLGLDRLPVTPVGAGFGYPSINYLQDGTDPSAAGDTEGETDPESKEVKANAVTTWVNDGNSTSTDNGNSTLPEGVAVNATALDAGEGNTTPLVATKRQLPVAHFDVRPLELAPPSATNQTIAGKPHSIIKGESDPWYEVDIDGGETFDRVAAQISGQEKNYYNGSEHDHEDEGEDEEEEDMSPEAAHGLNVALRSNVDLGLGGNGQPIFNGPKGRLGWQEIMATGDTPTSSSSEWQSVSASASASATPTHSMRHAPKKPMMTHMPQADPDTYAWSEEWGDWVSADVGDADLHVGAWDAPASFAASAVATATPTAASSGSGNARLPHASSSHMWPHASAGLS